MTVQAAALVRSAPPMCIATWLAHQCIFQSDVNAADVYMVINRAGLCKVWIEDMLPMI